MEGRAIVKTSLKKSISYCDSKFKCVVIDDSSSDDDYVDQSIVFSYTKPGDVNGNEATANGHRNDREIKLVENGLEDDRRADSVSKGSKPLAIHSTTKGKPNPNEWISQTNGSIMSTKPTEICYEKTILGQSMDESCIEVIVIDDDNDKANIPISDAQEPGSGMDELSRIIENSVRSTISNVESLPERKKNKEKEIAISNENSVVVEKSLRESISKVVIPNDSVDLEETNDTNLLHHQVDQNKVENDVIVKTFSTGERQRAWELMKTKKKVVSTKKIIYPVIVKENKMVEEAVSVEEKSDTEPVSPLLDLQSSLEQHIKQLVQTIQSVHEEEKKAIVSTLVQQHQNTNKEMVESMCKMLKNHRSGHELSGLLSDQKGSTMKAGNNTGKGVTEKSCLSSSSQLAEGELFASISAERTDTDSKRSKGKNIKRMNKNNQKHQLKQKQAPALSILKTPVRSRKPPTPFSEKSKSEGESAPTSTSSDCGYALLREILKDTSISSKGSCQDDSVIVDGAVSLNNDIKLSDEPRIDPCVIPHDGDKKKECIQPEVLTKGMIIEEPIVNYANGKRFTMESVGSVNNSSPPQLSSNTSVQSNTDSTTSAKVNNTHLCNKLLHCSDASHDNTSQLLPKNTIDRIYEYDVRPKLSLDERIEQLRKDFITPENRWLYESKENNAPPVFDTLQNAAKVLKDVQMTKKMLETQEFGKYNNMFNRYEVDPCTDENVVKVKKLVDKNIGKITENVKKKVDGKITDNVKKKIDGNIHERFPLKERNPKL